MAKLIYSLDGAFLGEFPLEGERMTIGRRPDNDIHIDNLAISGEHAAIVTVGRDAFLEDLDSTNGTLLNGRAIKRQLLQHGDVIELGKYQLKYVDETHIPGKAPAAPVDYEKTMIIRPAAAGAVIEPVKEESAMETSERPAALPDAGEAAVPAAPPPLPSWARPPGVAAPEPVTPEPAIQETAPVAAESAEIPLAAIRVLNGPSTGKTMALAKDRSTLGKAGVQVAAISRRPDGYFVSHVEGPRHPLVNGNDVGEATHQLEDRDVIEIAGTQMEFYHVED